METNYPILPEQHRLLAPVLATLAARPDVLANAMVATSARGTAQARHAAASGLGWPTTPESLLFAANGRAALAGCFAALVPAGGRVGFEAETYPVARAIAQRLGAVPVPLTMDEQGVVPDAIEAAYKAGKLQATYLQPTLHNPQGATMSTTRRAEIARLLERLNGPIVIEDRVYAFLEAAGPPPLATFAPNHVVVTDSLSKRIAPGLTLGLISAPEWLVEPIAKALVSGAWGASGFALEACSRWLNDGTVAALEAAKRADARARQALAAQVLTGLSIRANPAAYHLMLDLPPPWRAAEFVQAAGALGIAITPASAFAVAQGAAPSAVRVALAPPSLAVLASSLETLAHLAVKMPDGFEE
jgi:DNA-binding transcriptional MocR family regulator